LPGASAGIARLEWKVDALRREAEAALAPRFDRRKFHNQVLADVIVALSTLRKRVDAWIFRWSTGAAQNQRGKQREFGNSDPG